jgi:2,4-dienoyl-CoA reductase-like NADH-dependent reductase (Old Yellow Enzyme family)
MSHDLFFTPLPLAGIVLPNRIVMVGLPADSVAESVAKMWPRQAKKDTSTS